MRDTENEEPMTEPVTDLLCVLAVLLFRVAVMPLVMLSALCGATSKTGR